MTKATRKHNQYVAAIMGTGNKPYAQVMAEKPMMAKKAQEPCDVGLFSDDASQLDLLMLAFQQSFRKETA